MFLISALYRAVVCFSVYESLCNSSSCVHLCLQRNSICCQSTCCQCPWDPFIFSVVLAYFSAEFLTNFCCLFCSVPLRAAIRMHTRIECWEWYRHTHKAAYKLVRIWKRLGLPEHCLSHCLLYSCRFELLGPYNVVLQGWRLCFLLSVSAGGDLCHCSLWSITVKYS